jgi:hypothetical protein
VLHPVSLPECAKALRKVVALQGDLLTLACDDDPRKINSLKAKFAESSVAWLWSFKQKLIDPLGHFIDCPNAEQKEAIKDAFFHDVAYDSKKNLDDPTFRFLLLPVAKQPSDLAVSVGKWLENFYEVLARKGFPAAITGYKVLISNQIMLGEFDIVNTNMRVCPICDGTWMEKTSTGIVGSVDHFLPRSKYPALSVHPANLLPTCVVCNEKIKGNNDPLANNVIRTLPETVHSYYRPAREYLKIQISDTRRWSFTDLDGMATAAASQMPDVVDVPGRWQEKADELDRIVHRRIHDKVRAIRDMNITVHRDNFEKILDTLGNDMRGEWGVSPFSYPATWWLYWLKQYQYENLVSRYAIGD